jgi:cell division protein FtsW (lipid II flippase)
MRGSGIGGENSGQREWGDGNPESIQIKTVLKDLLICALSNILERHFFAPDDT